MRTALPRIDNCDDCGACCTAQEALPIGYYLGACGADKSKLPAAVLAELQALREQFDRTAWPSNGEPCVWYDALTRRCRHYEYRPDVCRDAVKPGDESCRMWRVEAGVDPVRGFKMVNGRLVETMKRKAKA